MPKGVYKRSKKLTLEEAVPVLHDLLTKPSIMELQSAVVAQVGGDHYSKTGGLCPHCGQPIQHWDLVARHPYLEAQISKYIVRWQEKGREEDLDKAESYFLKLRAVLRLRASKDPKPASGPVSKPRKTTRRRA
jgi:hypothetical protein